MSRFRTLLGVLSLAFVALLATAVSSPQAFAASWAPGVEAGVPADAATNPGFNPNSVSCASAGNCSAVGGYTDRSNHLQGLLLTETAGVWKTGVKVTPPASPGPNPAVVVLSVSCATAGNCSAVGSYLDSTGHPQGALLSETAGTWSPAVGVSLPSNAGFYPNVSLRSVSCASPGNCSAVGSYLDNAAKTQGLLLTETAGTWATAVEASLPANGSTPALRSVSCTAAGSCSAVGHYSDSAGHEQGLLLTETAGTWAAAEEVLLPADAGLDPGVDITSVSCTSPSACSAVGYYTASVGTLSDREGLLLTRDGGWTRGIEARAPGGAATGYVDLSFALGAVSCASAGNCSAVGTYFDSSQHQQGAVLRETAGTWQIGEEAILPADAGSAPAVNLYSVSCGAVGNCSAVGYYSDSSGHGHGLLLGEAGGAWTPGLAASAPANASTDQFAILTSASCVSPGYCGAIGRYTDSAGHAQGLLLSTSHRLTVLRRGGGRGAVTSAPAGINCDASCSHGFVYGKSVTLEARPAPGSGFTGWSRGCSGRGSCLVKMTADRTVIARFELLPGTKITKARINKRHQRARFKFKALGKSTGFQCGLVKARTHKKPKPHFSNCRSPKTYTRLAPGGYFFFVRALGVGGPDPTPAKKRFRL